MTLTARADPWPLYDLFLDVPHPAASASCPKPFWISSPVRDDALMEELRKTLPQIACFAFPEHDQAAQTPQPAAPSPGSAALNRYDYYAMQNTAFQQFTFTLQLSTGVRLHGHVRRYLPPHLTARARYDVGRRGERALVILTRAGGADLLYTSILKSIEAISSQQAAMPHKLQAHSEPQKWFLHQLVHQHQHLTQAYQAKQPQDRGTPLIADLQGLELGLETPIFQKVDSTRFIFPTSLLTAGSAASHGGSSIFPLLRCVGVAHGLRILSALLSERRVIMVSSSPTRLAACSHSALSMLAQGLLHWQHLYIPVLPPHLWPYLAAPYPYLIGILSSTFPRIDRTDGLGEVLIIHLDTNSMETRGMDTSTIAQRLPDLFYTATDQRTGQALVGQPPAATPTEFLGQELVELLKADKKAMYGTESALSNVGEQAAKATKAVKSTFKKLRNKGRQYLQKQTGSLPSESSGAEEQEPQTEPADTKSLAADYIYTESCHNAEAEAHGRVAFTTFFLCMLGDMRWYLSSKPGQSVPVLDRERFLHQKRNMGEGEGTAIWPLLQNFCQTQMLEEFVKARVAEVQARQPITPDAPLFIQCAHYHRHHKIDFGLLRVREVARQLAQSNQARLAAVVQSNVRTAAMALTSNKPYDGDYAKTVAHLVEQCRESSTVLFDVMTVVWLRLRDSRGMQWKHGYQALMILRNLLYHGPMAVIAEASDGLDKIRAMKYYENMRSQIVPQVRNAASDVYNLLVDRTRLFHIRRVCANRRWQMQHPPRLDKSRNLRLNAPFRNNHAAMHPNARGTIVNVPPPTQSPTRQTVSQPSAMSMFGSPPPAQPTTPVPSVNNDLMGLFDNVTVSDQATTSAPATNPFDAAPVAQAGAPNPFNPPAGNKPPVPQTNFQPTVVQLPPPTAQTPASRSASTSPVLPQQQAPRPAATPATSQPVVQAYPQGYPAGQTGQSAAPQQQPRYSQAPQQPSVSLGYQQQPPAQQPYGATPPVQYSHQQPPVGGQPYPGQPQYPPQTAVQYAPQQQQGAPPPAAPQQQPSKNPFDPFG